ncbi:MAG: Shedu immune nuclease family protein [Legionellales bacterium]|jgi:hypothetical protein
MNDSEYLKNYQTNTLYIRQTEIGKYVTVVNEKEADAIEIEVSPKIKLALKIFYVDEKKDIRNYELIKLKNNKQTEKISLSSFGLEKILEFNKLIEQLDLHETSSQKISLKNVDERQFFSILKENKELIEQLQNNPDLKNDIIALGHKRTVLQNFQNMLVNENVSETEWQDFFSSNQWIFGYGLQYRFNTILQKECHLSDSKIDGSNSVIGDFVIADNQFTTLVELKKSGTPLFKSLRNRSNTWKLSNELLDAFSQILEHKASGQAKLDQRNYDKDGNEITQITIDPKVILIIGSWKELEANTPEIKAIKKRTFELFRRDSRNVEILTFDELYERTKFIVHTLDNAQEIISK